MYVIFSFSEGTVEALPLAWCPSGNKCYWPPTRLNHDITKLIAENANPESDWILYDGKVIYQAADYSQARAKLKKSEVTSDLASEVEDAGRGKRRKFTAQICSSFANMESSEDDETLSRNKTKSGKGRKLLRLPKPPPIPLNDVDGKHLQNLTTSETKSYSNTESSIKKTGLKNAKRKLNNKTELNEAHWLRKTVKNIKDKKILARKCINRDNLQQKHDDRDNLQQQPDDRHNLQQQPDDRHNLQQQPDDRHNLQQQPDDRDNLQQQPDDRDNLQQQPDDRDNLQQQPDDRDNLQQQPDDRDNLQQHPDDRDSLQPNHDDSDNMQPNHDDSDYLQQKHDDRDILPPKHDVRDTYAQRDASALKCDNLDLSAQNDDGEGVSAHKQRKQKQDSYDISYRKNEIGGNAAKHDNRDFSTSIVSHGLVSTANSHILTLEEDFTRISHSNATNVSEDDLPSSKSQDQHSSTESLSITSTLNNKHTALSLKKNSCKGGCKVKTCTIPKSSLTLKDKAFRNINKSRNFEKKSNAVFSPSKVRKRKSLKDLISPTKERREVVSLEETTPQRRKNLFRNLEFSPLKDDGNHEICQGANGISEFNHERGRTLHKKPLQYNQDSDRRNLRQVSPYSPNHNLDPKNTNMKEVAFTERSYGAKIMERQTKGQNFDSDRNDEKFKKAVMLMLTDLNTKMDLLLNHSKETFSGNRTEFFDIEGFPKLPISSLKDLKTVESLLDNDEIRKQAIMNFSTFGGRKPSDCCKRIFSKVIAHEIVLKFNWVGSQQKFSFAELKLKNVIVGAIQANFKGIKEFVVEGTVQKFLRGASDRNGGRRRRAKKAGMSKETSEDEHYNVDDD